jgi:hypothetical protein
LTSSGLYLQSFIVVATRDREREREREALREAVREGARGEGDESQSKIRN